MDFLAGILETGGVNTLFFQILVALSVAVMLGLAARALGQSIFVGYLVAGLVIGPAGLNMDADFHTFELVGEIGVALLLFAIGLELPWQRLRVIGRIALVGGIAQMMITAAVAWLVLVATGLSFAAAIAAGLAISLSSTAVVLRVLMDRGEMDSVQGRSALGVLIAQDIATVVFLVIVQELGGQGQVSLVILGIAESLANIVVLAGILFVADRLVIRQLLNHAAASTDREFLSLLSIIVSLGAIGFAEMVGLSPAIGGFLAGVVIGDAPYAARVRAEIAPIRTALLALFFTHIGMLVDPGWIGDNLGSVFLGVLAILVLKPIIATLAIRMAGIAWVPAMIAGASLGQLGEFSFVVVAASLESGALDETAFQAFAAVSFITLVVTPWMVSLGFRLLRGARPSPQDIEDRPPLHDHIVIIGAGPTGHAVANNLVTSGKLVKVIDLHHKSLEKLENVCRTLVGDGAHVDDLMHAGAGNAAFIVVTVSGQDTAKAVIHAARSINSQATIVVRGRHDRYVPALEDAGAHVVISEEQKVGEALAEAVMSSRPSVVVSHN